MASVQALSARSTQTLEQQRYYASSPTEYESRVPPPPPPLPEETSSEDVIVKMEPAEETVANVVVEPVVVPPSPPPSPGPPSGVFVANTRLIELQAQMEFSFVKYMKLLRDHEQLKAQYQLLVTLPVGLDAFKDDLEAMCATSVTLGSNEEGNKVHELMDET